MMRRTILGLLVVAFTFSASAQISYGGEPRGIKAEKNGLPIPLVVKMPKFNVDSCIAGDELRYESTDVKLPFRFGFNHEVDLGLDNSGVWHTYPNGDRLWRVSVRSTGAFAINMEFHSYDLPQGAEVFVYNKRGDWIGSFTAESNGNLPSMGVQAMAGDELTVEYFEPVAVAGQGDLRIGRITHAYIDIFNQAKGFGASGSCNNNVICPEGDDWREEIASVARIVVNGNDHCTGQLINNCAEDGHPYFLTADHCLGGNVNNWVFWFNWESPTCTPTSNGPHETIAGATLLANSGATDVALLELSSAPDTAWGAVYTGWDKSGTAPTECVGIHHPAGDIKKITFDTDGAFQTTWGGASVWEVANWEDGTTEGGSSGSGLWNQDHRLIGQLFGGGASCTSITNDDYGRFDLSYSVLAPYLGSCGDDIGHFPPSVLLDHDIRIQSIDNIPASQCNSDVVDATVKVRNNGNITITSFDLDWDIDGGTTNTINWTGTLNSGQNVDVIIPTQNPGNGSHTFNATVRNPNGVLDQNTSNNTANFPFSIANPAALLNLNVTLDDYGSENTWVLNDANGNTLFTGGPYQDNMDGTIIVEPLCLGVGCYDLVFLDSYGDGMCCGYGDGGFTVTDAAGTQYVVNDGQFGNDVTENFCVTSVGINERSGELNLFVYPNPSEGSIAFTLPEAIGESNSLTILDAMGRVILTQDIRQNIGLMEMNLSGLANGNYLLRVEGSKALATGRFVLHN